MSIFERYAPFIQDFIYQNDWESLRAIQVAAGDAIFHTDENVLLSASTASGKTEAAFFPHSHPVFREPAHFGRGNLHWPAKSPHQRPVSTAERPLCRSRHSRLTLAR